MKHQVRSLDTDFLSTFVFVWYGFGKKENSGKSKYLGRVFKRAGS